MYVPEGTTFDPSAILNMYYDEDMLPEGLSEANLNIYTFNEDTGTWEPLDCTVDTENNCITTSISHFSDYAIIAGTRPADFSVGQLSITPRTVETGESVTVSCDISNNGDLSGPYVTVLKLDGDELQTRTLSLAGGESTTVSFTIRTGEAGRYTLSIGQAEGAITVEEPEITSTPFPTPTETQSVSEITPEPIPTVTTTESEIEEPTGTVAAVSTEDEKELTGEDSTDNETSLPIAAVIGGGALLIALITILLIVRNRKR